jgi:hypothetical protein
MSVFGGPSNVTTGLVLNLDAANPKSYSYAENLYTFSQQFDQSSWTKAAVTYTANNITAPDGTLTAGLLQETSAAATAHWLTFFNTLSANSTYTASCYFKSYSNDRRFFLQMNSAGGGGTGYASMETSNSGTTILNSGTVGDFSNGSFSITPESNNWVRLAVTWNTSSNVGITTRIGLFNVGAQFYDGNGTSGAYIWGAQLERNSIPNRYITTTSSAIVSSNAWIDLSLSKNNGTLANTPLYSSSNGSIIFSGYGASNNYISLSNLPSTLPQLTVEVWVNLIYSSNQGTLYIIGQTNSAFRLMYGTDTFSWVCATTNNAWYSAGTTLSTSALPVIGVWNHVVVVYDGTNNKCYVNGVLSGTSSGSVSGNVNMSSLGGLNIMKSDAGNVDNGSGQLSVARIYNTALTQEQILQNFNARRGKYGL